MLLAQPLWQKSDATMSKRTLSTERVAEKEKKNVVGDREPGSVIDDLPEFFEVDEFLGEPLRATSPEAHFY